MKQTLTPEIFYVGVDDTDITLFERQYPLSHGMSYNSYLIVDSKTAIMDSVEAGKGEQWIRQIEAVTGDRDPDYLIVHHMEPDHSSCIGMALNRWPGLTIVASSKAISMMKTFFPEHDFDSCSMAVGEGSRLELGTHSLTFFTAPMVHWPEVVVSYEEHSHILFSADAFGKFGVLQYEDEWVNEARRYYINIVGKYGNQVQALLKKLAGPPVGMIAPLHGPVLRDNLHRYLDLYDRWSSYRPETKGVVVAYASIYGNTASAACLLAEKLRRAGVGEVYLADLSTADQSEVVAQAFRLSSLVVASPTYDASIYPAMHDFLHHLTLKNYRNRRVAIIENGSWAPVAGRQMRKMLETLPGIEFVDPMVTIRSVADQKTYEDLDRLAEKLAE